MSDHKAQSEGRRTPSEQHRARDRSGRLGEHIAAACLMLKGYRILARRWRSAAGEIDLVAVRGRRLAFVEVKRRQDAADAEAAITPRQARRVHRAAEIWLARNPRFREHEISFDAVYVTTGRLPRHIENGL